MDHTFLRADLCITCRNFCISFRSTKDEKGTLSLFIKTWSLADHIGRNGNQFFMVFQYTLYLFHFRCNMGSGPFHDLSCGSYLPTSQMDTGYRDPDGFWT